MVRPSVVGLAHRPPRATVRCGIPVGGCEGPPSPYETGDGEAEEAARSRQEDERPAREPGTAGKSIEVPGELGVRTCRRTRQIQLVGDGAPAALIELRGLGRTLEQRASDVLVGLDRPGTDNAPAAAIHGRLNHLRGSALGSCDVIDRIAGPPPGTGGSRPRRTLNREDPWMVAVPSGITDVRSREPTHRPVAGQDPRPAAPEPRRGSPGRPPGRC